MNDNKHYQFLLDQLNDLSKEVPLTSNEKLYLQELRKNDADCQHFAEIKTNCSTMSSSFRILNQSDKIIQLNKDILNSMNQFCQIMKLFKD